MILSHTVFSRFACKKTLQSFYSTYKVCSQDFCTGVVLLTSSPPNTFKNLLHIHCQNLKYVLACILVISHRKTHTFLQNTGSVVNLSSEQ